MYTLWFSLGALRLYLQTIPGFSPVRGGGGNLGGYTGISRLSVAVHITT